MKLNIQLFADVGKVVIGIDLDTKGFDLEIDATKKKLDGLIDEYKLLKKVKPYEGQEEQLRELQELIEKTRNKYVDLRKKQDELSKGDFSGLKTQINSIGNSMQGIVHKVARWALAVIGVRSAYSAIRRAISLVSGENDKVANKFEQMRTVLANALAPLVERIANVIAKIMIYINYVYKFLTGKNLFNFSKVLSSGAKNTQKIAKNLADARKQIAGFDELNILGDNVTAAGGASGGASTPDYGNIFEGLQNVEIPSWVIKLSEWLKMLVDNWQQVISVVAAFGAALAAFKIAGFISELQLGQDAMINWKNIGIAAMVGGIVLLITNIANLIFNWDNLTEKQKGLSIALAGLGAAFVALGYSIQAGLSLATLGTGLLVAGIAALITTVGLYIVKAAKQETSIRDVKKAQDDLKKSTEDLNAAQQSYSDAVDRANDAEKRLDDANKKLKQSNNSVYKSGEELYNAVLNGEITYQKMNKVQREAYKAYLDNAAAQKNLEDETKNLNKFIDEHKKKVVDEQLAVQRSSKDYDGFRETIVKAYREGTLSAEEAADRTKIAMENMSESQKRLWLGEFPQDVLGALTKVSSGIKLALDEVDKRWEQTRKKIDKDITFKIDYKVTTSGVTALGKNRIQNAKGAIYLPKLAAGGVINMPGRGVPLGSAIGGERGAEGVIPLTDSQQMALLGEAIGRYITINANITNTMNGRVISKELQKINAENDFAYNR